MGIPCAVVPCEPWASPALKVLNPVLKQLPESAVCRTPTKHKHGVHFVSVSR